MTTEREPAASVLLVPIFAVATFLNAALLFAVEPMFTKMVLPLLGGTPSVWNTCLLFFQGALLVGYLYAHLTSRWLSVARQATTHLALLAISLLALPIVVSRDLVPPTSGTGAAIAWLLALLATTLGPPFVLLAAGTPMFQRWFATTRHPSAANPYFLYVASNAGSFVALLAYPTLIEPRWRLGEQSSVWALTYGGLIVLVLVAAWGAWHWRGQWSGTTRNERMRERGEGRVHVVVGGAPLAPPSSDLTPASLAPASPPLDSARAPERPLPGARVDASAAAATETATTTDTTTATATATATDTAADSETDAPTLVPTRARRLRWVLLAFAPSSLLLGVTTYLSTDIAAVPFLWIVPLALYLLSFVVVFARDPLLNRRVMLALQVGLTLGLIISLGEQAGSTIVAIATLHLVTFFVAAMVCHRELADSRPRAEFLTEFYLWMSVGGLMGGVFNVLLAPLLYDRVLEYPFAMLIALAVRPAWARDLPGVRARLLDLAFAALVYGAVSLGYELPTPSGDWADRAVYGYLGVIGLVVATAFRRPLRLALAAAALFLGIDAAARYGDDSMYRARSFFGVYQVRGWEGYVLLQHGTTTHGGQAMDPSRRREPLTYYHRDGPLGDLFRLATDSVDARSVALVGLGAGTTACYARPDERWTYYEIDPLMVEIARAPALFTYLRDCQPDVRIVVGDARLSLASAPDSSFDLLVLDAFSSDAIPVHLMTREALQLYNRKLRSGGVIAFHISNRYLDLRPVLVELARDARLAGVTVDRDVTDEQRALLYYGSRWVVLAAHAATLAPLVREADWEVLDPSAPGRLWTDDYSDVLGSMIR